MNLDKYKSTFLISFIYFYFDYNNGVAYEKNN